MGTQGDGNHFLSLKNLNLPVIRLWLPHHGSRGFGATHLYTKGMKAAEVFRKEISPSTIKANAWIPFTECEGVVLGYAEIVREWTKLNHTLLHQKVNETLHIEPKQRFWNEHNFVFRDGERFHAKGATPLDDDKFVPDSHNGLRLIPLNMREPVLVIRGHNKNKPWFCPTWCRSQYW